MSKGYGVFVFGFKWSEKKDVSSFETSETSFPTADFTFFSIASDCTLIIIIIVHHSL